MSRPQTAADVTGGPDDVYVLPLPWPKPTLNANDRHHWAERARRTREIRHGVAWLTRGTVIPRNLNRIRVELHYQPAVKRRRDTDASPTLKAAIDGLVDAGIVADDDSDHVESAYVIHPAEPGTGRLWLEITDRSSA